MLKIIILSLFLTANISWADSSPIIGGHAVVCFNGNQPISARLLEFYQAETQGLKVDMGPAATVYVDQLKNAIARIKRFSPEQADEYNTGLESMEKFRINFVPQIYIPMQDLAIVSPLPKDCKVQQIGYPEFNSISPEAQFTIDQRIWDLFSETDKAGFILHEFLLVEQLLLQANDHDFGKKYQPSSAGVRAVNTLIATNQIAYLKTQKDWSKFLFLNHFEIAEMCGGWAILESRYFDSANDNLWNTKGFLKNFDIYPQRRLIKNKYGDLRARKLSCGENGFMYSLEPTDQYVLRFNNWQYSSNGSSDFREVLFFDEQGRVRFIDANRPRNSVFVFRDFINVYDVGISANGNVVYTRAQEFANKNLQETLKIPYKPTNSQIRVYGSMELYDDGSPRRVILRDSASLLDSTGTLKVFPAEAELAFSDDGRVLTVLPGL